MGNGKAEEQLIKCKTSTKNDHGSDHLPIEIEIDLQSPEQTQTQAAYNYTKTSWELLEIKLEQYLPPTINPEETTKQELDDYAAKVTEAYLRAIKETTPRKKPSPHSKR